MYITVLYFLILTHPYIKWRCNLEPRLSGCIRKPNKAALLFNQCSSIGEVKVQPVMRPQSASIPTSAAHSNRSFNFLIDAWIQKRRNLRRALGKTKTQTQTTRFLLSALLSSLEGGFERLACWIPIAPFHASKRGSFHLSPAQPGLTWLSLGCR